MGQFGKGFCANNKILPKASSPEECFGQALAEPKCGQGDSMRVSFKQGEEGGHCRCGQREDNFGVVEFSDNYFSQTGMSQKDGAALQLSRCENFDIHHNWFLHTWK